MKQINRRSLIKNLGISTGALAVLSSANSNAQVDDGKVSIATSYEALRNIDSSTLSDGDVISICAEDIAGDFIVKTGTEYDDGGTVLIFHDDAQRYAQRILEEGHYNARWFAEGAEDDSEMIQRCIDAARDAAEPFPPIYLPAGTYNITRPLDRTGNGAYMDIFGDGRRSTILSIDSNVSGLSSVLRLASDNDISGQTNIRDFSIFCNNNAELGIDAQYMRYWTLENIEIRDATLAGIRCGNWVSRFDNNRFHRCPVGLLVDGIPSTTSSSNNTVIERNDFNTCPVGLKVEHFANDIVIKGNAFDLCEDAGIWINRGGRKIDIKENYFERCGRNLSGDGAGVVASLPSGQSESIAAAIVISLNPNAIINSRWAGAIVDNFFANVNSARCIALYNVEDGLVQNNRVHDSYFCAAMVDLRGYGCSSSVGKKLVTRGAYDADVVGKIVEFNTLNPSSNQLNLVIENQESVVSNAAKFSITDLNTSLWSGSAEVNSSYLQGIKVFQFVAAEQSTPDKVLFIDFQAEANHPLLGRYIRIHYASKGTTSASGVRCRVAISGQQELDIYTTSNEFIETGKGRTLYIPKDAQSLEFRIDSLYQSQSAEIRGFCICDAAYDLHNMPQA